jgi:epoxyqueuosine reductase
VISSDDVKLQAKSLGFDLVGVAKAGQAPHAREFLQWLDRGYAGDMAYMGRSAEARADPRARFPWAKSVICLAKRYPGPPQSEPPPACVVSGPGYDAPAGAKATGRVSCYATTVDYHDVMGGALRYLEEYLLANGATQVQWYVDTGPVLERDWAARAGLGWIGKNTSLINQDIGSWLFLAAVLVDLNLEADGPAPDRCGTCTDCIEACPTGAILAPYVVDSRLCLSYLTIEFKRAIPEHLRAMAGDWVFGCDACQTVCPWNSKLPPLKDDTFAPRPRLARPDLARALTDPAGLSKLIFGTPVMRARGDRLIRNLLIAAGNSGDARLAKAVEPYVLSAAPGLAEQVRWTLRRLRG